MPRLSEIDEAAASRLPISDLPWLEKAADTPGLVLGGIYLLAGEPGIGKTTVCMQIAGTLARCAIPTLYLTTEQSLAELKGVAIRVHGSSGRLRDPVLNEHLILENEVTDIADLSEYLDRHVFSADGRHSDVRCVILDSIQGQGQHAGAAAKYKALYDAFKRAKAAGCTMLLTGHATKAGQIAGPKALEHNVDCVLWFRRALTMRLLFVPKNRFGRSRLEPVALEMDRRGRLDESPRSVATSAVVRGYVGNSWELAECQARVSLPQWGSRPELSAPFLPAKKVQQLLLSLATLPGVDINDLTHHISCYLPAGCRYASVLDFPLAMSLLSSYFRREPPSTALLVGEVDLNACVRAVSGEYMKDLALLLRDHGGALGVSDIYISASNAEEFASLLREAAPKPDHQAMSDRWLLRVAQIAVENSGRSGQPPKIDAQISRNRRPHKMSVHAVNNVMDGVQALWPDLGGVA